MSEIDDVLEVLRAYGIEPDKDEVPDMPEVGTIEPGETIYATSLDGTLAVSCVAELVRPSPTLRGR